LNLGASFVISGNIQGMNSTIAMKNGKEGELPVIVRQQHHIRFGDKIIRLRYPIEF
jgi:hypothetical protein